MYALEQQGFVERVVVKPATAGSHAKHEWFLAAKGWTYLGYWNVPASEEVRRLYAGKIFPLSRG